MPGICIITQHGIILGFYILPSVVSPLDFVHSPSKHPSAPVEERLYRGGQSEKTPPDPGATD